MPRGSARSDSAPGRDPAWKPELSQRKTTSTSSELRQRAQTRIRSSAPPGHGHRAQESQALLEIGILVVSRSATATWAIASIIITAGNKGSPETT